MALVSGSMAIGIVAGPGLQSLFTSIDYPGFQLIMPFSIGTFNLSMFTAPACLACTLNVISIFILLRYFRESYVGVLNRAHSSKGGVEAEEQPTVKLPDYDIVAVVACCAVRFTVLFVFTNIET